MGLAIGAAYLLGGLDRMSGVKAEPVASPTMEASAAPASSNGQAVNQPFKSQPAQTVRLATTAATLRDRFHIPSLKPVVARPFHIAGAPDNADLGCLTQAVYYEARGESQAGQAAVAQVVLNRVRHPAFPKTICGVVHQRSAAGCQFTFACSGVVAAPVDDEAWRRSRAVASHALHGSVMASIGEATHFQTARSGAFAGLLKVAQIGAHVFYRFSGHAGADAMFHQTPAPSHTAGLMTAELKTEPKAVGHVVMASLIPTSAPAAPASAPTAGTSDHAAEATSSSQVKAVVAAPAAPAADKATTLKTASAA